MKAEEIRNLPIGTRVRGKFGEGVIIESIRYGKGVKFYNYSYLFDDDLHGFDDRIDEDLESLITEILGDAP